MFNIVRAIVLLACAYAGSVVAGMQFENSASSPGYHVHE